MGAVPIVESSVLDPLYSGLPVLIVSALHTVTPQFLHQQRARLRSITDCNYWKRDALWTAYWWKRLRPTHIDKHG